MAARDAAARSMPLSMAGAGPSPPPHLMDGVDSSIREVRVEAPAPPGPKFVPAGLGSSGAPSGPDPGAAATAGPATLTADCPRFELEVTNGLRIMCPGLLAHSRSSVCKRAHHLCTGSRHGDTVGHPGRRHLWRRHQRRSSGWSARARDVWRVEICVGMLVTSTRVVHGYDRDRVVRPRTRLRSRMTTWGRRHEPLWGYGRTSVRG